MGMGERYPGLSAEREAKRDKEGQTGHSLIGSLSSM